MAVPAGRGLIHDSGEFFAGDRGNGDDKHIHGMPAKPIRIERTTENGRRAAVIVSGFEDFAAGAGGIVVNKCDGVESEFRRAGQRREDSPSRESSAINDDAAKSVAAGVKGAGNREHHALFENQE